jgi:hypothetical protein
MPRVSHLRSDYPLNLTLLEHAHAYPSTWFYVAGFTPRTILTSPLRHNRSLPIGFYQWYSTNSCSFACVPCNEFRLHVDEQLTTPVEIDMQFRSTQYPCVAGVVVVP